MKKILIIEDDLIVRSIYRRKFEISGYTVETAEEGGAALALLSDFKPDVIQVDIMMPGMNGVEAIKQIRARPEFKKTPILVLSSFYRPDLAKDAWKAGANKCVSKMDCTPNLALDLVEQLLADESSGFTPIYGTIPLAKDALDDQAETPALKTPASLVEAVQPNPAAAAPEPSAPETPKLRLTLDLPPTTGEAPSLPKLGDERPAATAPKEAKPEFFGGKPPAPFKSPTLPTLGKTPSPVPPATKPIAGDSPELPPTAETTPASGATPSGSDFRVEIRQEFLRRAPQIQSELRNRVSALIKSKSTDGSTEPTARIGSLCRFTGQPFGDHRLQPNLAPFWCAGRTDSGTS